MKLSACIVTYNDREEALRAAASVLEHTRRHPLTLYLVDNASPDGTGPALRQAVALQLVLPCQLRQGKGGPDVSGSPFRNQSGTSLSQTGDPPVPM